MGYRVSGKRTPLGWHIAALHPHARHQRDARAIAREALGGQLGDKVLRLARLAYVDGSARRRIAGTARASRPRVRWEEGTHSERAQHVRRFVAFTLCLLERVNTTTGRAAHRKLWLGRTYSSSSDGKRAYVRGAHEQLGLAARIGVTVRTLEQYTAILVAGGVLKAWQPMERHEGKAGVRAPKSLPRTLRGEVYAYNHYQLTGPVPYQLQETLGRWYGRSRGEADATPRAWEPRPPAGGIEALRADDELAAAIAELGALFDDAGPPS